MKNAVFDLTKECSATMEADIRNQYPWARLKPFTHALDRIQQVLDANADTPAATPATSPIVAGPRSVDTDRKPNITTPTEPRNMSLASRTTWRTLLSENDSRDFFDLTKGSDIKDLCQRIGLENVRTDYVAALYKYWLRSGRIREFLPGKMLLQYYYITMVDTYTLAHALKNHELEYAILLQFQVTNFEHPEELPAINKSVDRAFKHLPSQSPLCKWIAILYSCHKTLIHDGDYDEFIRKTKLADPIALGKFVYGVASVPHSLRGKQQWLERWCSVHDHVPDSDDDHRCMTAERFCKNILSTGVSPGFESSDRLTKKRSLDRTFGYNKKFKPNDRYSRGR